MSLTDTWGKGPQYFCAYGDVHEVYSYYELPVGATTPSIDQTGFARWNSSTGGMNGKPTYLEIRGRLNDNQIQILKQSGAKPMSQKDYISATRWAYGECNPAPDGSYGTEVHDTLPSLSQA